jgi:hypothetical protein
MKWILVKAAGSSLKEEDSLASASHDPFEHLETVFDNYPGI